MAIFNKLEETDTADSQSVPKITQTRPVRSNNVSVIGPTMVFKGELTADEDLIIEGQIEGTISHHNKHLTVGEKGRVKADIHASSVIVLGQLIGDIRSEGMVSLAKGANVKGNIYCARIVMADGAKFKGKIDMGQSSKGAGETKTAEEDKPARSKKPRLVAGQSANASKY